MGMIYRRLKYFIHTSFLFGKIVKCNNISPCLVSVHIYSDKRIFDSLYRVYAGFFIRGGKLWYVVVYLIWWSGGMLP